MGNHRKEQNSKPSAESDVRKQNQMRDNSKGIIRFSSSEHLPKRELGKTGLHVTPLCIGTAALGNMPEVFDFSTTEEEAKLVLQKAFASPLNFIDTASNYSDSERRIGNTLREIGGLPEGCVLATKVDRNMQSGDFSGDQVKRSIEQSLILLGIDSIQLVYLHDPEHSTFEFDDIMAKEGPVSVLHDYKNQGIIEHIGIAGGPIDLLTQYVDTHAFEVVITHNRYNLVYRTAEQLIDKASEKEIAIVNAALFGSGILAKGIKNYPRFAYRPASEDIVRRVRKMEQICEEYNVPLKAAALQFSLKNLRITSTIVGMTKPGRIEELLTLTQQEIPNHLWEELDQYAVYEGDPEAFS